MSKVTVKHMSKTIDKRTLRTRHHLQSTLHDLLKKVDYEAITVEAICRHGKVSRSTFYTHFKSKDDLKRSALDRLHVELSAAQVKTNSKSPQFAFSRALFEHARSHIGDYQALGRGRGGRVALSRITQIVTRLVRKELSMARGRAAHRDETASVELEAAYIVGALMSLLTCWLNGGARVDVDVVDTVFVEMTQGAVLRRR